MMRAGDISERRSEWSVGRILKRGADTLRKAGAVDADRDAALILSHVMCLPVAPIFIEREAPLSQGASAEFLDLIDRRAGGEPVQYITGNREFMSLEFRVRPGVLIPRPETEILVEEALTILKTTEGCGKRSEGYAKRPESPPTVVDVGTGSGAIGVSIAHYAPYVRVIATDIDETALRVAKENALKLSVFERVEFLLGDLLDPVSVPVNMILANLPYIRRDEFASLPKEVRDFEPGSALVGGREGTEIIESLIDSAPEKLVKEGWLLLEVGAGQSDQLRLYIERTGRLRVKKIISDLQGIDRVIVSQEVG